MENFPQMTHLDVQVYSLDVPALEPKTTMFIRLYLKCTYSRSKPRNPGSGLPGIWLRYAYFGVPAAIFEESTQHFCGFGLEEALLDGDRVIEAGVGGGVVEGPGVTGLGIRGRVDEAVHTGGVGGAGAHRARFQGGVEGAAGEPPPA